MPALCPKCLSGEDSLKRHQVIKVSHPFPVIENNDAGHIEAQTENANFLVKFDEVECIN